MHQRPSPHCWLPPLRDFLNLFEATVVHAFRYRNVIQRCHITTTTAPSWKIFRVRAPTGTPNLLPAFKNVIVQSDTGLTACTKSSLLPVAQTAPIVKSRAVLIQGQQQRTSSRPMGALRTTGAYTSSFIAVFLPNLALRWLCWVCAHHNHPSNEEPYALRKNAHLISVRDITGTWNSRCRDYQTPCWGRFTFSVCVWS